MSPEQARGRPVDRRADIWAFGCVLYEMLAGRRPFDGDDVSVTLASVLKTDPDWKALGISIPLSLRRLLSRCLAKDPKERLQAIGDARIEISELLSGVTESVAITPITLAGPLWRRAIGFAGVALACAALGGAAVWLAERSTVARPRVLRLAITAPGAAALSINNVSRHVAITPDGSRVVYVGANGTTLFVRPLDQMEATPVARGIVLTDPFVSPDGQWVGFFDGTTALKKVAITGGPAELVTRLDSPERGATWAADGTIIIGTSAPTIGLRRVNADGGAPAVLTRLDRTRGEIAHLWPELLPGGDAVLYTAATPGGLDAASIAVLDLRSGRSTTLLRGGSQAQFVASGHLVYAAAGALRAVAFDATRRIVVGTSSPVVPQVVTTSFGAAEAALARDGTLAYVAAGAGAASRVPSCGWTARVTKRR